MLFLLSGDECLWIWGMLTIDFFLFFPMMEEFCSTRYQRGSFSSIIVGSGFCCLCIVLSVLC